jgi:exonuclease VII large subunit
VRATALGRGTHGVSDVGRLVQSQFHIAFPHRVWVAGQVRSPAGGADGALRFRLHTATSDEVFWLPCVVPAEGVGPLRALLSRTHDAEVGEVVREGRLARVGGLLRFDAARGGVVFVVSELDPTPTAAELAEARVEALRAVVEADLPSRQRSRRLPVAPLDLAVVAGAGDGAVELVEQALGACPFDVRARVLEVDLTGPESAELLAQAVRTAGQGSDVVLLVRDQGRPLGLASYDVLAAASAVADAPVPVVTGLGGDGTRTACDEVAFAALPTATAAVRWVLSRLEAAHAELDLLAQEVDLEVDDAAGRCRQRLQDARREADRAAQEAAVRSEHARRRRRRVLWALCAALAVLAVLTAVLTGRPVLLLALLVPGALAVGVPRWWGRTRTTRTGSRGMGQRDDDFGRVLERLHAVRDELTTTNSPERVAALRELAGELGEEGRRLLLRHVGDPGATPAAAVVPAAEVVPGAVAVPTAGEPAAPDSTTVLEVPEGQGRRADAPTG